MACNIDIIFGFEGGDLARLPADDAHRPQCRFSACLDVCLVFDIPEASSILRDGDAQTP